MNSNKITKKSHLGGNEEISETKAVASKRYQNLIYFAGHMKREAITASQTDSKRNIDEICVYFYLTDSTNNLNVECHNLT